MNKEESDKTTQTSVHVTYPGITSTRPSGFGPNINDKQDRRNPGEW